MRRFLPWLVVAAVGVAACPGPSSGSCQVDADCANGARCNHGLCYAAVSRPSGASSTGGSTGSSGPGSSSASSSSTSTGATTTGRSTAGHGSSGSSAGSATTGGSSTGAATTGGAITCAAASTSFKSNSQGCGTERWSVKTGTDTDVLTVNTAPMVTTIAQLAALPVPSNTGSCTRSVPTETQVWELQNVNLEFHDEESDSDYHVIATDNSGNSMIVEIPFPGCVGNASCSSNQPFLCEVTHARAYLDGLAPSNDSSMGVGTVIGVGFFDYKHGQDGVAPNAIELHPVLALCVGQDCNPLQGY